MSKKLVFASWPYTHTMAGIHNAIPILAADAVAQFYRHMGHDVVFIAGTDEYGARTEIMANKLGIHPQELVDRNYRDLSDLLINWLGVSFTAFSRTTADFHQVFVQDFYRRLERQGYVSRQPMRLLFCPDCGRFLPDRFVEGTCPRCGVKGALGLQCKICGAILEPLSLKEPTCAICSSEPVVKETDHWFLDLPRCADAVSGFLQEKSHWSDKVKKYARDVFHDLQHFAVTRDIKWGIPAPFEGAEGKSIYCWAESLLGDLSTVRNLGREEELWKNADVESVFFMGRDNIPFYAILFPALLITIDEGYNLPSHIVGHDFLTFEGKPCSKSSGNGIWLDEAEQLLGNPDYWRFYLLKNFPMNGDVDFQWDEFVTLLNDELVSKLNAFVYQVLQYLNRDFAGLVPQPGDLDTLDREVLRCRREVAEEMCSKFEQFEIHKGLETVMQFTDESRQYLQANWQRTERSATTLYVCVELCRAIAVLIHPYMPHTAERIWELFGFNGAVQEQDWMSVGKETHRWKRKKIAGPENLFRRVDIKVLRNNFKNLRRKDMSFLKIIGEYCETWLEI